MYKYFELAILVTYKVLIYGATVRVDFIESVSITVSEKS